MAMPYSDDSITNRNSETGRPSGLLDGAVTEADGRWPAAGTTGHQIGTVHVDGEAPSNGLTYIEVTEEGRQYVRRDLYISVQDREQGVEFLGRIIEGPYYMAAPEPDPAYGITVVAEILGQLEAGERLVPTPTRPRPQAAVCTFPGHRLRRLLGVEGDFYLGQLIGAEAVPVHVRSTDKNFLPRNVGIFGTVGSGKSNTMQVLMEEALRAGWAVAAIDVEGEYVGMDRPTDDPHMTALLQNEHGLEPGGVEDFRVYVPASGRSGASAPRPFKVPISALQPEIVADILEFSEAHMRMFEAATRNATSRTEYLYRQEGAYGGPAAVGAASAAHRPFTLQDLIDGLQESSQSVPLIPRIRPEDLPTAASLRARLIHLGRSDVLDWSGTAHVPEIPIDELVVGGRLSVLDVSEADDRSRNIAIAYVLQALFECIVQTPIGERMPTGQMRPPLLVVMEEVHTFVSRATAHRMRAVLDNLQIISRRGRKRWMALALVSQQPNHVPDELFELANTRFMHQMKSTSNLNAVKSTTGGVPDVLWSTVSTLGPGQCLVSGSGLKHTLLLGVRPACSQRLHMR